MSLFLPADLDNGFSVRNQRHRVAKGFNKKRLEMGIGHITAGYPNDLWRSAVSFDEIHEVLVFGHDNGAGISRLPKYLRIFSVAEADIANVMASDFERLFNPPRHSRGELSIYPNNHAARIGWLTRWLAKRRHA
jgi:hypothetical protein